MKRTHHLSPESSQIEIGQHMSLQSHPKLIQAIHHHHTINPPIGPLVRIAGTTAVRLREVSGELCTHLGGIRMVGSLVVSAFRCLMIWESPKAYPKQVTSRSWRDATQSIIISPRRSCCLRDSPTAPNTTLSQAISPWHGAWRIWLIARSQFPRRRVVPFKRWRLSRTRQRTRRIKRAYECPDARRRRKPACGTL